MQELIESQRPTLLSAEPADIVDALKGILPDVDQAAISGEMGTEMVASIREGLSEGADGWIDDDLAFVRPWGVDPSTITTPVTLWQGDLDLMVPVSHGRWLAEAVPGADLHLLTGEGHLSITVNRAEEMVDVLLALA